MEAFVIYKPKQCLKFYLQNKKDGHEQPSFVLLAQSLFNSLLKNRVYPHRLFESPTFRHTPHVPLTPGSLPTVHHWFSHSLPFQETRSQGEA